MKIKEIEMIGERFGISCQIIQRGIKTLTEALICRMGERRSAAHPVAERGGVMGDMLGMFSHGMRFGTGHHINMA